jgi:hypothetical protein
MPRPAAATPDQIRSTVLAMLAEAGDATPASGARFRQLVSVRKLRARLGAGDPATLARALNGIEAEVVRTGLAEIAIPCIPPDIAEQMRALWQAAVTVQLDDIVRLKAEAQQAAASADAARTDAELRVELLREELAGVRAALNARDAELADLRAQHALLQDQCATLGTVLQERQAQRDAEVAEHAERGRAHVAAIAETQHRYEALSRQLLQETAHQREALKKEHAQSALQLKFAERRIAALEGERERMEGELVQERGTRQQAVGEALALKAINATQHAQLAELMRVVSARDSSRRAPPASPGLATAKRTRTAPKGSTTSRTKKS